MFGMTWKKFGNGKKIKNGENADKCVGMGLRSFQSFKMWKWP
jgi:hypothetical protein